MHLNCKLVLLYVITGFLSLGWGLTKPRADLGPLDSDYLTLGELRDGDKANSYLDCIFDLDDGEELKSVTWYHGNVSNVVFVWKPDEESLAYEFLVNRVNMTRDDGKIQFLERHREYEGVYFCKATTNTDSAISDPYEMLTADFGSRTYYSGISQSDKDCVEVHSLSTPALYPPPQVTYGVWDGQQWILKIPLMPIIYSNGSRQYTLQDREIETDKFPEGSSFRLKVGFLRGEEYIPIWTADSMIQPCTKTDTDNGNEGGGDGGDEGGSDGGSEGSDDNGGGSGAPSHPISLVSFAAIVLCVLFVH